MSTELKAQAARANGAKSRGPTTPEGRARSALNATTHGLAAATVVLANESRTEFEAVELAYREQFQPRTQLETDLLAQLVAARWRLQRVWATEASLLNVEMMKIEAEIQRDFESISEPTRTALAFLSLTDKSQALSLLNRYETRHRRTFERALETLQRLRNESPPNEPNPEAHPSPPSPSPPSSLGTQFLCGESSPPPAHEIPPNEPSLRLPSLPPAPPLAPNETPPNEPNPEVPSLSPLPCIRNVVNAGEPRHVPILSFKNHSRANHRAQASPSCRHARSSGMSRAARAFRLGSPSPTTASLSIVA